MFTKTIKSKITPVGLDLGETAVRGAQLRRTGGEFVITRMGQVERPKATGTSRPPFELDVARLFSASSFKGKSVVAALNPPEVEFHVLELPQAALQGGADAQQIIHWEIGRLTPGTAGSTQQVETRHWLLPARPGNTTTATAIGVCAPVPAVTRLLHLCAECHLHCTCVDTGATALHRLGSLLRSWDPHEIWGVLDLGSRQSRLLLCLADAPILIRHTGGGGQAWTERIAEALHLSPASAEIQKRSHGIAALASRESRVDVQPATHDEVAVLLLGALRSELNDMAAEIKRSYEYVLNSYPGRRAGDLVLVGGGAALPNLPEFLSGILGIPVRRFSSYLDEPHCRIRLETKASHACEPFASAIGLAISSELLISHVRKASP